MSTDVHADTLHFEQRLAIPEGYFRFKHWPARCFACLIVRHRISNSSRNHAVGPTDIERANDFSTDTRWDAWSYFHHV